MIAATLSSPKPAINCFSTIHSFPHHHLRSEKHHHEFKLNTNKFNQLPAAAAASGGWAVPCPEQMNAELLEKEFGDQEGVSFTELGESCVVKMDVTNGSVATLMLPSGLITSYKPMLWHGGKQEVLHTCVSDEGVIQGGISLALAAVDDQCDEQGGRSGFSWSSTDWLLNGVRGNTSDSIQVEIVSTDADGMVEVKHAITLNESSLISEIKVSNSKYPSSINLMVSVLSHLTVSTPDATYAVGLEGSNFMDGPPLLSDFSIIPPKNSLAISSRSSVAEDLFRAAWPWGADTTFSGDKRPHLTGEGEKNKKVMFVGEERANYKHLTDTMSRIYTSAPRKFTLIDRGKRNSVIIGRKGFEELYTFSPGSSHEWYGKYAYVSVGQSNSLKPIILEPQHVWTGEQQLHNPNL